MNEFGIELFKEQINDSRIGINREPYFSRRLSIDDSWKNQYDLFCQDFLKFTNVLEYRNYILQVKRNIIYHLNHDGLIRDFIKSNKTPSPLRYKSWMDESQIQNRFVIIDENDALFSILSKIFPERFFYESTWYDFISHFTDLESIKTSKRFKVNIFNGICNVEYNYQFLELFSQKVADRIQREFGYEILNVHSDEVSIKLKDNQDFKEVVDNVSKIIPKDEYHFSSFKLDLVSIPNRKALVYKKKDKILFKGNTYDCFDYYHLFYKTYFNIPITDGDWILT